MIADTIRLLKENEHYGAGDAVEFAKGSDKMPTTLKEGFKKIKRKWRSRRK